MGRYTETKKTHNDEIIADVHAFSAGLKAYITAYIAKALNTCRQSCGGHGHTTLNHFGALRNDHDIFQTFVGDDTVLQDVRLSSFMNYLKFKQHQ